MTVYLLGYVYSCINAYYIQGRCRCELDRSLILNILTCLLTVSDFSVVSSIDTADCLRECCEQVLFLAASVCESMSLSASMWVYASVRKKSRKLLVGICPMEHAKSGWMFVTFDLWLWELFSYFFNSGYIFWMAWPSNFIFSLETRLQNI